MYESNEKNLHWKIRSFIAKLLVKVRHQFGIGSASVRLLSSWFGIGSAEPTKWRFGRSLENVYLKRCKWQWLIVVRHIPSALLCILFSACQKIFWLSSFSQYMINWAQSQFSPFKNSQLARHPQCIFLSKMWPHYCSIHQIHSRLEHEQFCILGIAF